MRGIKFRAWDKIKEEMLSFGELLLLQTELIQDGMDGYTFLEDGDLVIMQYTGLKDIEGQEIYEGDIVEGEIIFQGRTMEIKGRIGYNHCRYVVLEYNCLLYEFSNQFDGKGKYIKIIGNKYENPKLLEEIE